MEVGTDQFTRSYNALQRIFAGALIVYVILVVLSQRQLAIATAGLLFLVLSPITMYYHFALSRANYDTPIPFAVNIIILGTATLSWIYIRFVELGDSLPSIVPILLVFFSTVVESINSKYVSNS